MEKHIVIVGNGRLAEEHLPQIVQGDVIIGVDRAAYWLIEQGKSPDIALGDFDSTSKKEFAIIKHSVRDLRIFSANKDWTDMELAVNVALSLNPTMVSVFGGVGTRLDHTVGTILLLETLLAAGIPHGLYDENNHIQAIGRGRTILRRRGAYPYVSILAISSSLQLSLSDFKYNLAKKTIRRGQTIGISNEFVGPVGRITIHRGKALVIQSRD